MRLVFAALAWCAASAFLAEADTPTAADGLAQPGAAPIKVSDLNDRPVIGELGLPLGKIVTIEGRVADGAFTHKKADAGETLLRIQKVDGRPLKPEVIFPFAPSSTVAINQPAGGSRFKYSGYESGGFVGSPPGKLKSATTSFHFTTWFEILKDESAHP